MPFYHFAIHKGGARTEGLGIMELVDDTEALDFGKRVIQDMIHRDPEHYAGWTMDITNGDGPAAAVLFDTIEPKK
jgi:hypothetical protein